MNQCAECGHYKLPTVPSFLLCGCPCCCIFYPKLRRSKENNRGYYQLVSETPDVPHEKHYYSIGNEESRKNAYNLAYQEFYKSFTELDVNFNMNHKLKMIH